MQDIIELVLKHLDTILLVLIIFLGYFTIIYGLSKFGIFKKYNISLFGPIIMWRTKRGRKLIDKLSRRRTFWRLYGNFAIALCIFAMIFMFFTLMLGAIIAITIPTPIVPIHHMLVLPGINPIIPLWYGIFALAVAIILHEFTHGILARRIKLKIKSLGVLLFIIPIGAFVEPDEKQMEKINRTDRARIFAGGPATNIIFALIFAGIFSWVFMAALEPVDDGVLVLKVDEDYYEGGIKPWMIITAVEGVAANGTKIEQMEIETHEGFSNFMDQRKTNDKLNLTVIYKHEMIRLNNITLIDRYNYSGLEEDRGMGFIGINTNGADDFVESLAHPVSSAGDNTQLRRYNLMRYFFLPVDYKSGILPFHSPLTDSYEVTGPMSVLPNSLFWVLANTFYFLLSS